MRIGGPGLPILELGPPRIHYVSAGEAFSPAPDTAWRESSPSTWSYTNAPVHLELGRGEMLADGSWTPLELRASVEVKVRVLRYTAQIVAPSPDPPLCLDRTFRWAPVRGVVTLPEFTPLVIRWSQDGRTWELRSCRSGAAAVVRWQAGRLAIDICLDATALHPRWSFSAGRPQSRAARLWEPGERVTLGLLVGTVSAPAQEPIVIGRFPRGAQAGLTLTDHSDFDTVETLRVLLGGNEGRFGWVDRGLRMTKGVFTLPSASVGKPLAPSLQDTGYRTLLLRLRDDGSEIAPHGVNQSGQPSPHEFRQAVSRIAKEFGPRTWIDHGLSLEYCYSMGGADDPRFDLLTRLREHGFIALWSYDDAPAHSTASLNLLAPVARDLLPVLGKAMSYLRQGDSLVAAHYVRTALQCRARGRFAHLLLESLSVLRAWYLGIRADQSIGGSSWRALQRWARVGKSVWADQGDPLDQAAPRDERLESGACIYPERAMPLNQVTENDLLLFTTSEVLHLTDAYTPAALERLVGERGLHIGHTYLLNRLSYLAGAFQRGLATARLSEPWLSFLEALEASVRQADLWNPTMAELAEWVRATQLVKAVPLAGNRVLLRNEQSREVAGLTVLLPPGIPPEGVRWSGANPEGCRPWGDWLAVWGTLPGSGAAVVEWPA